MKDKRVSKINKMQIGSMSAMIIIVIFLLAIMGFSSSSVSSADEATLLEQELIDAGYGWLVNYNLSYPSVDVYEKDGNELIASFEPIKEDGKYRILLTNLVGEQASFDLKVKGSEGGGVEFDWIVDPTEGITACGVLDMPDTLFNLTTDPVGVIDTCFTITANNITLEGNGHTIYYGSGGTGYPGIIINGANETTIKNLNIILNYSAVSLNYPILIDHSWNTNILNNNITTGSQAAHGIYSDISYNNSITGNKIIVVANGSASDTYGIYFVGSAGVVDRSFINQNNITVFGYSRMGDIGIMIGQDNVNITNNFILMGVNANSTSGIKVSSSNVVSRNNRVFTLGKATNAFNLVSGADNFVAYGDFLNASQVDSNDTTVGTGAIANFTNVTIANERITVSGTGLFYRHHYLDVQVNDNTNFVIENANVSARDKFGSLWHNALSSSSGLVSNKIVLEYVMNSTNTTYYYDYTANATRTYYLTNGTSFNISANKMVKVILSVDPTLKLFEDGNNMSDWVNDSYWSVSGGNIYGGVTGVNVANANSSVFDLSNVSSASLNYSYNLYLSSTDFFTFYIHNGTTQVVLANYTNFVSSGSAGFMLENNITFTSTMKIVLTCKSGSSNACGLDEMAVVPLLYSTAVINISYPTNNSIFIKYATLNFSVTDNGNSNEIWVWASNNTNVYNSLVYHGRAKTNGNFSYYWDAPVATPASNMVLLLHFDNLSSMGENTTSAYDWTGLGNNATMQGIIFNVTGKFAYGIEMNGIAGARNVSIADPAGGVSSLDVKNFTIMMWFYKRGNGTTATAGGTTPPVYPLIIKGVDEADGDGRDVNFLLGVNTSGQTGADYEDMTGANHPINNTATTINDNQWYHVAYTRNDSGSYIYLNGVLDGSRIDSGVPANNNISVGIGEGRNSLNIVTGAWNGSIDDVVIFNRSLSASEISNYYTLSYGSGIGAAKYWNINVTDSGGLNSSSGRYKFSYMGHPASVLAVSIDNPLNQTYYANEFPLNFNVSLSENGSVKYTLNGGINNFSMSGNQGWFGTEFNASNLSMANGGYTFFAYANSTTGLNATDNVAFSVNNSINVVRDCGTLSNAGMTYTLVDDLSSGGDCLTIGAENITLNGAGFEILFSELYPNYAGITVNYNNFTLTNAKVRTTTLQDTQIGVSIANNLIATFRNINITLADGSDRCISLGINSGVRVYDSYVGSGVSGRDYEAYFSGTGSNVTFVNTTLKNSYFSYSGNSFILKGNYLDAYANYTNGSVATNTNVSAFDVSGNLQLNVLSGSNGWIAKQDLMDYRKNSSTTTVYSNYTINATNVNAAANLSRNVNASVYNNLNFMFTEVDRIYPIFSSYWDDNSTLIDNGIAKFNVTLLSTNGTVFLQINNINYTALNISASVYNVSVNLSSGVYPYYWMSWGNGTLHNYNISSVRYYTLNASDNEYPIFSNYWDDNSTLVGNGIAKFNVTLLNTNGTVLLQINNTNYTALNLTAAVYNVSVNLSGGVYPYYWLSWGNGTLHNYNISSVRYYTLNASILNLPQITINSPANNSNVTTNYALLNWTVQDDGNNSEVWVWVSNSSGDVYDRLVYHMTRVVNGTYNYNLTSLPLAKNIAGLVLLHSFDNNASYNDSALAGSVFNNANVYGTPIFMETGKFAGAIRTSSGNSLWIQNSPELSASTEYTIVGWFNMSSAGTAVSTGIGGYSGYPIFNKGIGEAETATQNVYFSVGINSTNNALCNDMEDASTGNSLICSNTIIVNNVWNWFAVVVNTTAQTVYINGVLDRIVSKTVNPTTASIHRIGIGRAHNSVNTSSGVFNGQIDEIAFFNRSLVTSEVLSYYNLSLGRKYWVVNATDGTNMNSSGTYEFNMTVAAVVTDNEYPLFSSFWDNNATLLDNGIAKFNVTLASTNGTVFLQINNTNYTALNISASVYNVSVNLSSGVYPYYWMSWGNGTLHNYNISSVRYYTVNSSAVVDAIYPNVTLNAPINYANLTYTNVTFNCTSRDNVNLKNVTLYFNSSAGGDGTITLVQNRTNSSAATTSSVVCILPSAATSGNLIITAVASDKNAGTYTVPSGFIMIQNTSATSVSGALAYKVSTGGETSILWSETTAVVGGLACWAAEYSGLSSSPLDVSAENETLSGADTAGTSIDSGLTGTTAQANELAIFMVVIDTATSADGSRTLTNGFSEAAFIDAASTGGNVGLMIANKTLTSTGAQSSRYSVTDTGDQMYAAIATFKAASSGTAWHANQTTAITGLTNETTFQLNLTDNLTYNWNCYACDAASNCNWSVSNYTLNVNTSFGAVDSTAPILTINSPINGNNYTTTSITFNVTLNENGNCRYSLDSGINNVTMQNNGNTNFNNTNNSIGDRNYLVKFYCNDTIGNVNNTAQSNFSIDSVPGVVLSSPANADILNYTTNVPFICNTTDRTALKNVSLYLNDSQATTPENGSITIQLGASAQDSEECIGGTQNGNVYPLSTDLELGVDTGVCLGGDGRQWVGLRFINVQIPQGATIWNSSLEFEIDVQNTTNSNITIYAEAIDNATAFPSAATTDFNLSSRTRTGNLTYHNDLSSPAVNAKLTIQNISAVIQEIINRPGWVSGNSIVILVNGTGTREVESYDGETAAAAKLYINYTTSSSSTESWILNQTINITGTSNSTTFYVNLSDNAGYKWNCLAYDSFGSGVFASSNFTFTTNSSSSPTDTAPVISLNAPASPYANVTVAGKNITFNCSATDSGLNAGLSNISLWITNSNNASFSLNQTTAISGTSNSTTWNINLGVGTYTWNCQVKDSSNQETFGANRSITMGNAKQIILIGIDGMNNKRYVALLQNNQLPNFAALTIGGGWNGTANITGHTTTSTAPGNAEMHTGLNETLTGITDNTCNIPAPNGNTTFERIKVFDSSIITGNIYGKGTCYIPDSLLTNAKAQVDWWQNLSTIPYTAWQSGGSNYAYAENVSNKAKEFIGNYSDQSFYFVVYFGMPDGSGHASTDISLDYNQSIIDADNGLGILLDTLTTYGLRGNRNVTQIIISADHGWNEGTTNHDTSTGSIVLPLITNNASLTANVTDLREQCDIAPTILNYFGMNSSDYTDITNNGCGSMISGSTDNEYPLFSNYWDDNSTLVGNGIAKFNVTLLSTNGTVLLQINNTNYTALNISASVYNVSVNLSWGVYPYYWLSWGNGTSHNYNISGVRYYTINTSVDTTAPIVTINKPESEGINYSTSSVVFNVTLNENGSCSYSLNAGTINITMQNNGNTNFNATNSSIADGTYTVNYYCNDTAGNWNRTASRAFGIDATKPLINYGARTPQNGTTQTSNSLFVDVDISELNFANATFRLFNSTRWLLRENTTTYHYSFDLGRYSRIINNSNLALSADTSGVAYNPVTNTLFMIHNTASGEKIDETYLNGTLIRSIDINADFTDTEGIGYLNSSGETHRFVVVEEGLNNLTIIFINNTQTSFAKSNGITYDLGLGNLANSGLEGITYDWGRDLFYSVREGAGTLMEVYRINLSDTPKTTSLFNATLMLEGSQPGITMTDLSDLHYDNNTDTLFLLSHESLVIANTYLNGTLIRNLSVNHMTQPEGITFDTTGDTLYVVGEADFLSTWKSNNFTSVFNWTGLDNGVYYYNVTAYDTAGNKNTTDERMITIGLDREYPIFSAYWDDNASLTGSGIAKFNVTLLSTNGTVFLQINNTNYTALNISASVYNVSVNLSGGVYPYYWISWGNGSSHNFNISGVRYYTVNATAVNIAPQNPSPDINSTTGTNKTLEDLHCYDILVDPDGGAMNVSVEWYNNSVLALRVNYNNSYANNSVFDAVLDDANTTKNQNWSCGMRLNDGVASSSWVNTTSTLKILNSIPTITLLSPESGNVTTNRTPTFSWSGADDDSGDTLQYEFNLTCYYSLGGRCTTDDRDKDKDTIGSALSYSVSPYLKFLSDNGYYYNWTGRVWDGEGYSNWASPERKISIQSDITISLPVGFVSFGLMNTSMSENTSDDSPYPLVLRNDGNALLNISVNFTSLFVSTPSPTNNFMFKVRNTTVGCFDLSETIVNYTAAPTVTTKIMTQFNFTSGYQTGCNNVSIDLFVNVPVEEPPGNKYSTVTFISSLGEP